MDVDYAGSIFPNGDETANNDGWAAFSGTSAAAPQLAGAAALVKQAFPRLNPAQVRSILMNTARDVTTGHCNTHSGGFPATVGPDTATGNGLVDAEKAALVARPRSLSHQYTQSVQPAQHRATATEQARPGERKLSPEELKSLEEMVGRGEIGFRDMEE